MDNDKHKFPYVQKVIEISKDLAVAARMGKELISDNCVSYDYFTDQVMDALRRLKELHGESTKSLHDQKLELECHLLRLKIEEMKRNDDV